MIYKLNVKEFLDFEPLHEKESLTERMFEQLGMTKLDNIPETLHLVPVVTAGARDKVEFYFQGLGVKVSSVGDEAAVEQRLHPARDVSVQTEKNIRTNVEIIALT